CAFDPTVDGFHVRKDKFEIDRLNIAERIYSSGHMGNIRIFKAANDVHDRIHFTNVGKKFVAQTFALARTFDEAGDVHKLKSGRNDSLSFDDLSDLLQPLVRNFNYSYVRVNGTKGVV